jgi:hypothetical protein
VPAVRAVADFAGTARQVVRGLQAAGYGHHRARCDGFLGLPRGTPADGMMPSPVSRQSARPARWLGVRVRAKKS